jgi:hypothetical protein
VPPRVQVAELRQASLLAGQGDLYRERSFVPAESWQAVPQASSGAHLADVGVFHRRVPSAVRGAIDAFIEQHDWRSLTDRDAAGYRTIAALLEEWAAKASDPTKPIIHHGFHRDEPGLMTVTTDGQGLRLGMHIDSWDGSAVAGRQDRGNRICANFGPSRRYLLVLPTPIWNIASDEGSDANVNELIRLHMAASPPRRVMVLRIEPGEAYIAPTEALIHDASTWGCEQPCVAYTMRGCFLPPLNPPDGRHATA